MPRKKHADADQHDMLNIQERLTTAPCVPAIRQAVREWRERNYPGATDVTRELLNFWFQTEHRLPLTGLFRYHNAQREAIETLIYLYEVAQVRRRADLLKTYAVFDPNLRFAGFAQDDFARYCVKMATGSGKTLVMALSIVWQFANAMRGNAAEYAKTFLILAPNVIVFDRLRSDFESGQIFRRLPLIPKHLHYFWDMACYMRGEPERAHTEGAVYLTNIQQFYERPEHGDDEPDAMTGVLGAAPASQKAEIADFDERIAQRDGLVMVLNDEAHHTHQEENQWNQCIRRLHDAKPLAAQLDFSATPRRTKGNLFEWTVFDYPLKQAILDRVVKRPLIGVAQIDEAKSDLAEVRYRGYLIAAVERWKEYVEQLAPSRKKPILFVMLNDTHEAEQIGGWLRDTYKEHFGGDKLLVIHTNRSGDVAVKDLDAARKAAREVDAEHSPVNAIVSVLMLREGWDVQNVTVVVGLRPYSAKANILPEQTIGRGLRLMFRNARSSYIERVDIIGNRAFIEFVEDLETLEGLKFDTFQLGKEKLNILTVQPMAERQAFDLSVPQLSPLIGRKKSLGDEIAALDVMAFQMPPLPMKSQEIDALKTFIYEGRDLLTKETLVNREYHNPPAQTPEEIIGYYARRIAQNIKLPSQFAAICPKLREFFERKAFGQTVDLDDPQVILAMNADFTGKIATRIFESFLRTKIVEPKTPEIIAEPRWLSATPPFVTSKTPFAAKKTVFNYTVCDNDYELAFAKFLDAAPDVAAFAKLPMEFDFAISYTDTATNIRHYFPDFLVKRDDGSQWIVETKGLEDVNVARKDEAAQDWCAAAAELTGAAWEYLKALQTDFESFRPETFAELLMSANLFST